MDTTNAGTPSNNAQLSGDATRLAAIERLKKLELKGVAKTPSPFPGGPPGINPGPPRS